MMNFPSDLDASNYRDLIRARALDACRWLQCAADGEDGGPTEKFLRRYPHSLNHDLVARWRQKAAVGSAPSAWGSELVSPPALMAGLLDLARPSSLIDRLVALGARRVPINVSVNVTTSAASNFIWAGAGVAKPLSSAALETVSLPPATAAGLLAISSELFRHGVGTAEAMRDLLVPGLAEFTNLALVDASNAGSTDPFSPRSLTNHGSPVAGSSTGNYSDDLRVVLQSFIAAGGDPAAACILISSSNAAGIALLQAAAGGTPTVDTKGGVLAGVPALASESLADQLVVFDVHRLIVAEPPDALEVAVFRHVSAEMLDAALVQDGGAGVPTQLVSFWQTNCFGVKAERRVSWAYNGPVSVIDSCDYLGEGSPA
jgi:hypothetical protein